MSKSFWKGFRRGLAKPVHWPVCWSLYGIGHIASKLIDMLPDEDGRFERTGYVLYRTYQWCMCTSSRLQELFDISFGPWVRSSTEELQDHIEVDFDGA